MKLNNDFKKVSSNCNNIFNFTIEANQQAFKILTDNLYENKISSIIRELFCNAYDSHIQAKVNEPIDIHVPSSLEPYFYIKDKGLGAF